MKNQKSHFLSLSFLALLAIFVSVVSCAQGTTSPSSQDPSSGDSTAPNLVGTWTYEMMGCTYVYTFTATTYTVDMVYNGDTEYGVETGTYTITSDRFFATRTYPLPQKTEPWGYTYSNENGEESFHYNYLYLTKQ